MEKDGITVALKSYSLQEVLQSIQAVLKNAYDTKLFWVRCELSRINLNASSGHAYLELIEKNESAILAQLRGIIWSDKYLFICEKFLAVTKTKLTSGIQVMFQCSVNFHPVHGLSLFITDIEPVFTLGEMARMKNEAIARLKKEGLYDLNRQKYLALIPGRIAIISVDTSRGYQDFISTIENYPRSFQIKCRLFEAVLQGENAVPSFIRALKNIESQRENFDAVVIIRGGAGDAGLSCYDEYELAAAIAGTSLPVITGIGHATNETVVEMVSFKNCITPTAAATFLLEKFEIQSARLEEYCSVLRKSSRDYFLAEKKSLASHIEVFSLWVGRRIHEQTLELKNLHSTIPSFVKNYISITKQFLIQSIQTVLNTKKFNNNFIFLAELDRISLYLREKTSLRLTACGDAVERETERLSSAKINLQRTQDILRYLEEKITLLDPINTLKRGYSITRLDGKIVFKSGHLKSGSVIETTLSEGTIYSTVEKK